MRRLSLVALCLLVSTSASAAATTRKGVVRIDATCAGDTISAKARVRTGSTMRVRTELWSKSGANASFRATGKARTITAKQTGWYRVRFDISRLNAYAYRVKSGKSVKSRSILAASCAPGHQVPDAPFALLLPLSLLALGLPIYLLRRRSLTS